MADEQWEESDGKTPSTDGEWFHDENGDWAWAYYDATLNTAWQARRGKLIEIVLSHPSCWELEEMGDHLLAEAGAGHAASASMGSGSSSFVGRRVGVRTNSLWKVGIKVSLLPRSRTLKGAIG
jgi:hypothetical protein